MKKILFASILFILSLYVAKAQHRVNFVDVKGVEIGLLIDLKSDNSFNDFFLFRYAGLDFSKQKFGNALVLSEHSKDFVKFKDGSRTFTFTINKDYKSQTETVIYG